MLLLWRDTRGAPSGLVGDGVPPLGLVGDRVPRVDDRAKPGSTSIWLYM